jgi:23S rRNA pseudouridine1911/1915/1917 synthase
MLILYEDNHCLAVSKPAPLLTQAPAGIPSLEALARAYLKEKYHKSGHVYLGIPHRLDRPVSGVVLFARSSKAAARLAEQFQQRQVRKVYWALVESDAVGRESSSGPTRHLTRHAQVEPAAGAWEDWLLKIKEEARSLIVSPETAGARQAVLSYRTLQITEGLTLLEVEPQTGRMHQIRVQAASRGWPVCGDVLYGSQQPFGPPATEPRDRVIGLHARSLTFLHPIRYEPITVTAPLPSYWPEGLSRS